MTHTQTLVYLHGFLSSPQSSKAQETQHFLQQHAPEVAFVCPQLAAYPSRVSEQLDTLFHSLNPASVKVIGSSMGGFWATYLVEKGLADQAVLINPAVLPASRFTEWVGVPQRAFYADEIVTLSHADIEHLNVCDVPKPQAMDKYWLLVQTGDQTLDYRLAVDKYQGSKQTVETGGNHAFTGYDQWLPQILEFFYP